MRTFLLLCTAAALLAGCGDKKSVVDPRVTDASRPLVLLTHPHNPPCSYRDASGVFVGTDIDRAKKIAARMGRELVVEPVDFEKIIPRLKEGSADLGIASISITDARRRDVDFSDAYAATGSCFMYRTGDPAPRMSQLHALRVAAEAGTRGDIYLCLHGGDPLRFSLMKEAEDLLDNNEVDYIFCDEDSIRESVAQSGGRFARSPVKLREATGIAVDKRRPDVLAAANAVIAEELAAAKEKEVR